MKEKHIRAKYRKAAKALCKFVYDDTDELIWSANRRNDEKTILGVIKCLERHTAFLKIAHCLYVYDIQATNLALNQLSFLDRDLIPEKVYKLIHQESERLKRKNK